MLQFATPLHNIIPAKFPTLQRSLTWCYEQNVRSFITHNSCDKYRATFHCNALSLEQMFLLGLCYIWLFSSLRTLQALNQEDKLVPQICIKREKICQDLVAVATWSPPGNNWSELTYPDLFTDTLFMSFSASFPFVFINKWLNLKLTLSGKLSKEVRPGVPFFVVLKRRMMSWSVAATTKYSCFRRSSFPSKNYSRQRPCRLDFSTIDTFGAQQIISVLNKQISCVWCGKDDLVIVISLSTYQYHPKLYFACCCIETSTCAS